MELKPNQVFFDFVKAKINLYYIWSLSSYRAVNTLNLGYKTRMLNF